MDDVNYLEKKQNEEVTKTKKKPRYLLFVFLFLLICGVVTLVTVLIYYKYNNAYDNSVSSFSENEFNDLEITRVIDIEPSPQQMLQDSSYVSIDELEQYVILSRVDNSIYLIPKDNRDLDIYKNEEGKLIIKIKD